MNFIFKTYLRFTLILLIITLLFGVLACWAFLYPETYKSLLPFQQVRPFHVTAALFWIFSGAALGIMHYKNEEFAVRSKIKDAEILFMGTWFVTIIIIFINYSLKHFGGREYWEFPPELNVAILAGWILFMFSYFIPLFRFKYVGTIPAYIWMWSTGLLFFLFTLTEQNLYSIPWFRSSFLREMTIQWKSNGSMVGAWNQMVYGTALFLMVKISGDGSIATNKKAYFSFFLGLTNLVFNWGHHIYNVPSAAWIRTISYSISMTEWVLIISIIQGFRSKLEERKRLKHLIEYKFLIASEFWIFINLLLALLMSIPAINRYTHGTHITVAHAMGTTIGINTMILLASISYMLNINSIGMTSKRFIGIGFWITQISLLVFWLTLLAAGILKGYETVSLGKTIYADIMKPVLEVLNILSYSGVLLMTGITIITIILLKRISTFKYE